MFNFFSYDLPLEVISYMLAFLSIVAVVAALARSFNVRIGSYEIARDRLETETEHVRKRLEQGAPDASREDRQYYLASEYHAQGLVQSKISFWFSLIFASVGVAVIIIAIFAMDRNAQSTQQARTFVTLIPGTIIEAVSALFFVQSNRARRLMVEFFDKLRVDRKRDESLRLADQVSDTILQSRLKIILALNFADVHSHDGFLSSLLNIETTPNAHEVNPGKQARNGKDKSGLSMKSLNPTELTD